MKNLIGSLLLVAGLTVANIACAQMPEADALGLIEATDPVSPDSLPYIGTYFSAAHPNLPPLPADMNGVPAWNLGGNVYLLDDFDTGGFSGRGLRAMADPFPPGLDDAGDGDTNDYYVPGFQPQIFTTNQLWLQMVSVTDGAASMVIHPPWDEGNGVHDLYYTTNLLPPIAWQWLLRTAAGQTNLLVPDATDGQGFYQIRPPDDLAATDSEGTNFWLAFMNVVGGNGLSLAISSPVGAAGAVTVFTNGPVLIITNYGDAAVEGTYVLTNLSADERAAWSDAYGGGIAFAYANGTNQVVFDGVSYLYLIGYDGGNGGSPFSFLYYKYYYSPDDLTGADWENFDGSGSPAPVSWCAPALSSRFFTVAAGGVTNIGIPPGQMISGADDDAVHDYGVEVTADAPVAVYGLSYAQDASTAFTACPATLLGTNYLLMAYAGQDEEPSEFAVVATEDGTTVTITPSAGAQLNGIMGFYGTNAYTETLDEGQTYEISSFNTNDLTGTRVAADRPVAVFAGAVGADVPAVFNAANPVVQEQLPIEDWGTQALAMGFAGRLNGDTYRILAAYDDTTVSITGRVVTVVSYGVPAIVTATNETLTTNLDAGQFCDLIIDGPVEFQGTKPIQVAHFANGADFDNPNQIGDPCEILLPPTGHYLMTNIVVTLPNDNTNGDFVENYLNIIIPQSATNATFVDGSLVAATNFVPISMSGYYGAQITVTNSGTHKITSSQPIGVEVYGWGRYDAYGYFGGIVK